VLVNHQFKKFKLLGSGPTMYIMQYYALTFPNTCLCQIELGFETNANAQKV